MKEMVALSGKGGTGKTSLVASFAVLSHDKVLCDCDVDAADLHLLIEPRSESTQEFFSGQTAFIDAEKCTQCGLCQDFCRFTAIQNYTVDPASCERCGFCSHVCPEEAVSMKENMAGHWFISETGYGPMVHARLGIAEENSGKLVMTARTEARRIAEERNLELIITDGPPGIGCPVISSLSGADLALLVTEPTLSGIHDLERVLGVCQHFGVPAMVCVNRCDINEEKCGEIKALCGDREIEVIAQIPFANVFIESLIAGVPVVNYDDGAIKTMVESLWKKVFERVVGVPQKHL